jgi:hypothetical protein
MSSKDKTSFSRVAVAAAVMIVAALFAIMTITEWWPIIVTRNAERVAAYYFGSESMMAHGGWRYSNPNVYAWTCLSEAFAAVATLPPLWMAIVRRSRKAVYALAFICALYVGCTVVLGEIQWSRRATLAQSAAEQAVEADGRYAPAA